MGSSLQNKSFCFGSYWRGGEGLRGGGGGWDEGEGK